MEIMKKLVMLIMVLVVISPSLIGQNVGRNSFTNSGFLFSDRIKNFYRKLMMKHNGTEFTWMSKKQQSRRLRKEQKSGYVFGEKLRKK